jgi:hypothetical protein
MTTPTPLVPSLAWNAHLKPPQATPLPFSLLETARALLAPRRPLKSYRLVLHSDDRVAGSSNKDAVFQVGDLHAAWQLDRNAHEFYDCVMDSFVLTSIISTPVEVHGTTGWPLQSESYDSATGSASTLLGVASAVDVACRGGAVAQRFTLTGLPGGRLGVRLGVRDAAVASAFGNNTDSDMRWHMVLTITPGGAQ